MAEFEQFKVQSRVSQVADWYIYFEETAGERIVLKRDIYGRCEKVIVIEKHDTARTLIAAETFLSCWLRAGGTEEDLTLKDRPALWALLGIED